LSRATEKPTPKRCHLLGLKPSLLGGDELLGGKAVQVSLAMKLGILEIAFVTAHKSFSPNDWHVLELH
jgi:hypothetical protein